jgi:hypothetical protein
VKSCIGFGWESWSGTPAVHFDHQGILSEIVRWMLGADAAVWAAPQAGQSWQRSPKVGTPMATQQRQAGLMKTDLICQWAKIAYGPVVVDTGGGAVVNLYTNPREDVPAGLRHIPMSVPLAGAAGLYMKELIKYPPQFKIGFLK